MPTHPTYPTAVKLDKAIKKRLENLGKLKQRTAHWLMKMAIIQYLEREEQEEKSKQETLSRWEEAIQNKVVKHKAVIKWLESWGSTHEIGRPLCEK